MLLVAREGLEHDVLNHTFNQCYTTTESEQTLPVIAEFINVFSFVLMVHTAHNGGEARIAKRYFCKAAGRTLGSCEKSMLHVEFFLLRRGLRKARSRTLLIDFACHCTAGRRRDASLHKTVC